MRILVTGGAGYVGSVVTRALLRDGHDVTVFDSLLFGGEPLLSLYPEDGFRFLRGDIRSAAMLRPALEGVEAVVHLAAIVGDSNCARQPEAAKEVNLNATRELVALARASGVRRFVFASTCSNYGRMADPEAYLTESSELRPVSLYAETKVAVERELLSEKSRGMAPTVLRFATVFGVSPRMRFDLTVNEFVRELATVRRLVVYGEQFWRPYVHVRDAARAVCTVLAAPVDRVDGEVFNVGDTAQNYRKRELVELVRAAIPGEVEITRVPQDDDPRDYRVSFERIRERLAFRITRTVPDGIREVLGALRQGVTGHVPAAQEDNSGR